MIVLGSERTKFHSLTSVRTHMTPVMMVGTLETTIYGHEMLPKSKNLVAIAVKFGNYSWQGYLDFEKHIKIIV